MDNLEQANLQVIIAASLRAILEVLPTSFSASGHGMLLQGEDKVTAAAVPDSSSQCGTVQRRSDQIIAAALSDSAAQCGTVQRHAYPGSSGPPYAGSSKRVKLSVAKSTSSTAAQSQPSRIKASPSDEVDSLGSVEELPSSSSSSWHGYAQVQGRGQCKGVATGGSATVASDSSAASKRLKLSGGKGGGQAGDAPSPSAQSQPIRGKGYGHGNLGTPIPYPHVVQPQDIPDSSEDDADGSDSGDDDAWGDWTAQGSSRPHSTSVPEPQVSPGKQQSSSDNQYRADDAASQRLGSIWFIFQLPGSRFQHCVPVRG